jgi:hypothetical protein
MGSRSLVVVAVALGLLVPTSVSAQWQKPERFAPDLRSPELLAEEVRAELAKTTYLARRDLPAGEDIFVEGGRVPEEMLARTSRPRAVAVSAGQGATVLKVIVTETSIQVLFREKCSVTIVSEGEQDLRDRNVPELVGLARSGLSVVFHIGGNLKRKLPT